MKRKMTIALVLALVLILTIAVTVFAQGRGPANGAQGQNADCLYGDFVDEDGDGVCDNAGQRGANQQSGRLNRQGVGGQSQAGPNFADEDENGDCDNVGEGAMQRSRGGQGGPNIQDDETGGNRQGRMSGRRGGGRMGGGNGQGGNR